MNPDEENLERAEKVRKLNCEINVLEKENRTCLDTIKKNNRLIVTKKHTICDLAARQLTFEGDCYD
jgi:hypothetical protein